MSTLFDAILTADVSDEQSKLSAEAAGLVWGELRDSSMKVWSRQGFADLLKGDEDKFMEQKYASFPESKKKDGTWKYRKFNYVDTAGQRQTGGLPPAWSSSKSVINRAYDENVQVVYDMSKTQVEALTKAAVLEKEPQATDWEKLEGVIRTAKRIYEKLSLSDQDRARIQYSNFLGE